MLTSEQIMLEEELYRQFIESDDCIPFVNAWIKEIQVTEVPTEIYKELT